MAITSEDRQITKEIVLAMIEKGIFIRSEYPNTETVADMICDGYKTILKTVSESRSN